jgi:hypothetical protein
MSKHPDIVSLIHSLKRRFSMQIPKPQSKSFDLLLSTLYSSPASEILSLKSSLISDLSDQPRLLNDVLTLLHCCHLQSLLSEDHPPLSKAYSILSVLTLLAARTDTIVDSVCSNMESIISEFIAHADSLATVMQWLKFLEILEDKVGYNPSSCRLTLETRVPKIAFEEIAKENCDLLEVTRVMNELAKNDRLNLKDMRGIVVDNVLSCVPGLEANDEYWRISELLGVVREGEEVASKAERETVQYYYQKYGATETEPGGIIKEYKENSEAMRAMDLAFVQLGPGKKYASADKQTVLMVRQGQVNSKNRENARVAQYKISANTGFAKEIERLRKMPRCPNLLFLYGFFECRFKDIPHLLVVTEQYDKKSTLWHRLKTSQPIDYRLVAKGLLTALAAIENSGLSHRQVNPKTVIYEPGSVKLTLGSSLPLHCSYKNFHSFLAPELTNVLFNKKKQEKVRFIKADVYSFGATLFFAIAKCEYSDEKDLARLPPDPLSTVIASCLHPDPSSRPLFSSLLTSLF